MIRENQKLMGYLNVLSDGVIVFLMMPLAFWIRFCVMPDGVVNVPLSDYLRVGLVYTLLQLFTYAAFELYRPYRHVRLYWEMQRLVAASLLDMLLLMSWLYQGHYMHYSRLTLGIFCALYIVALGIKRLAVHKLLWRYWAKEYNQKRVLLVGGGAMAARYAEKVRGNPEFGYRVVGYVADEPGLERCEYLGGFDALSASLEAAHPDEVVSAIEPGDYDRTPQIIAACEKAGVRLAVVPFYAEYMPPNPQFDDFSGVPLMNIRRIPLDNWGNAFCKRAMDVVGSALLLLVTSPLMLVCAVGVKLSSPGPIVFKQERIGRDKKKFYMYKFRSMRVNDREDTGWSSQEDSRKTKFGAFIRKCSLDEILQFWNVLKGDMSLVGPRPEVPHYVEQFKDEVPLYMVKHQVRPGITGWAQVNGYRGDTSIVERIKCDVYYIEHWSIWFDVKILFMTVFQGKFINDEKV